MLAAMAILPFLDVCAKYLGGDGMPIMQIVWARMICGAVFTLPFVAQSTGWSGLRPQMLHIHVARAVLLIASTAFFFLGLKYLPIADTLALFFVQPILVTSFSPFLLGEHVGWRRWLAVIVGCVGVLIIVRPGFQAINPGTLFGLLAGLSMAVYLIITRRITGKAPALVTTFQTNLIGALALSIAMPFIWYSPSANQIGLMLLLGLVGIVGHYWIVRSYDYAEASLLAPLGYTEIIMAVFVGWYFFGDFPDQWTLTGVGILIACAIYISWRERQLGLTTK